MEKVLSCDYKPKDVDAFYVKTGLNLCEKAIFFPHFFITYFIALNLDLWLHSTVYHLLHVEASTCNFTCKTPIKVMLTG